MHFSFITRRVQAMSRTRRGNYRWQSPSESADAHHLRGMGAWGPRAWIAAAAAIFAIFGAAPACGSSTARSPFVDREAGVEDGAARDGGYVAPPPTGGPDSGPPDEPGEWGGPCIDDGNCNDAIDCTEDVCDGTRKRCHFIGKSERCEDEVFCNGEERCVPGIGCRAGDAEACSDGTTCTIDACDEETHSCSHSPRDADSDGDPDANCPGGGDCNDQDPAISSERPEICLNTRDDDCDGLRDESDCEEPAHDDCGDALAVSAPGVYAISAAAARADYSATCIPEQAPLGDVVLAIQVPDGEPVDVDVGVTVPGGEVVLAAFGSCGSAASELACSAGTPAAKGSRAARLLLRGQPPGEVFVTLFTNASQKLAVVVDFPPATLPPGNETCGTAAPLAEGVHVVVPLAGTRQNVAVGCAATRSDLVYAFTLEEPRDVLLNATAVDAFGNPVLSLRRAPCVGDASEIACGTGENQQIFRRALQPGQYFVVVGSTGQSAVDLILRTTEPTPSPPDDDCVAPPVLDHDRNRVVDLAAHEDDIAVRCAGFGVDAAYGLTVDAPSDVLLVVGLAPGDYGGVSLSDAACSPQPLACRARGQTPVRTAARNLAPGEYRVVIESQVGGSVGVAAFVRPTTPPVLVPFSDDCDDAFEISPRGGVFQGNTTNQSDDHSASCGVGDEGAPDQFLSLHLDRTSRVVLDARGSAFSVILDVRSAEGCPGAELPFGCSAGHVEDSSFVDLVLSAGDYWVQIDGYGGQSGAWTMDAFVSPVE
jgi:hypothetical protein